MKKFLLLTLLMIIIISGCAGKSPPIITSTFTPPEDKFPSEVDGVIKYSYLDESGPISLIGPISSYECSKYIESEPGKSICYLVLAIKNKDKELCSFVKNYTIFESGCTCRYEDCCKNFNWTLNKERCKSIVGGEIFECPFESMYDKFKEPYNLSNEQIKLSREFGILCRNEFCLISIAKNQTANISKSKEICDSIIDLDKKSSCYAKIAPLIAVSNFDFALDLCNNIPKKSENYNSYTVDCYRGVAESIASTNLNKSLELCNLVFNYPVNSVPYTCYWGVAWKLPPEEGIKICNQYIPAGDDRDWCFRYLNYFYCLSDSDCFCDCGVKSRLYSTFKNITCGYDVCEPENLKNRTLKCIDNACSLVSK